MQEGRGAVRGAESPGLGGDSIRRGGGTESVLQSSRGEEGENVVVAAAMGGRGGGAGGEKPSGPTRMNNSAEAKEGSGGGAEQSPLQPATGKDYSTMEDEELKMSLKQQVLDITSKVEELYREQMERLVTEVNRKRASLWKAKSPGTKPVVSTKDRDKEKAGLNSKKQQQLDASRRDIVRAKRMAELMRQLGTILRQIAQHKWAWPFMHPVDAQLLNLHDYHQIIKNPMDLGTIRDRMDVKDGTGYKHVQEICADVRLVFSNALKYNIEGSDVHIMAKTLSEKFEEKWKAVLEPKLLEEDVKRKLEERETNAKEAAALQAAEEAAIEKLALDAGRQLEELDKSLEDLKRKATPGCRPMTIEEKRQLGHSLGRLPADNLQRVIQIIAQKNPGFNASADEVEVDIDAQEPATLWRLHRYVQSVTNLKDKTRSLAQSNPMSNKRDTLVTTETLFAKRQRKVATP